jgi:hypothetical protein
MATTSVEFDCPAGLSLTLELYAAGSDTLSVSSAASERANDRGSYVASVSLATGTYRARVRMATNETVARGILRHQDAAGIERVTDDDLGVAGSVAAAQVWSHATRTLTQSALQIAAIVSGSGLTVHRGDTLVINLTGLGNLAGRTSLWFTAKQRAAQGDAEAQVQIEETGGLLVLAGSVPTEEETATLVITDETAGNVTIAISAAASRKLSPTTTGVWDVQVRTGDTVSTLSHGSLKIVADVTQRIE